MSQVLTNSEAMLWAIKEARKGEGHVAPNPLVGCCILDKNNRLLSVGAHLKFGENHAEINALEKVSDRQALKGAKVFVTLEPCAKQGKTPSCAKTLGDLPVAEVHYAVPDPNPKMAGGAKILEQAGVQVFHFREFQEQGEKLAEVFLTNQKERRCFFHLKVGSTLDGLITDSSGNSQWITSEESRYEVQRLRGVTDAVLIGRGTFESDNPRLQSRHHKFKDRLNFAVVIDPMAKVVERLSSSSLCQVRPIEKVVVVTNDKLSQFDGHGCTHLPISEVPGGQLNLRKLGERLLELGISSVLVEGGDLTFSAFFRQGLADRLSLFMSPSLMGGLGSKHWLSQFETKKLSERVHLTHLETQVFGNDICISGVPTIGQ